MRVQVISSDDGFVYMIFDKGSNKYLIEKRLLIIENGRKFVGDNSETDEVEILPENIEREIREIKEYGWYKGKMNAHLWIEETVDAEDIAIMPGDEFTKEYKYNKLTGKIIK